MIRCSYSPWRAILLTSGILHLRRLFFPALVVIIGAVGSGSGACGTLDYACEVQNQITQAFYAGGWRNYATVNEYLLSPGAPLSFL